MPVMLLTGSTLTFAAGLVPETLAQTTTSLPEEFTGACATDPSAVCQAVKDWTGSDFWASAAEWFVARPLSVAIIVLVAWIANRIAHVLIKRGMARLLDPERMRARRVL